MRVFISYAQESQEHENRVRKLANALANDGFDCWFDKRDQCPREGWPRWMKSQLRRANFVLVVATEEYMRRYDGDAEDATGRGSAWEGHLITQELYNAGGKNEKYIPVVFRPEDVRFIPLELQGTTYFDLSIPDRYDDLRRHITNEPARPIPPVVPRIASMPPVELQSTIRLEPEPARERREARGTAGSVMVSVFDGTRYPFAAGKQILLRIRDGNQKQLLNQFYAAPTVKVDGLPVYGNFGDNYTVLVSADGYQDAGFTPVKILAGAVQSIDLMLVANNASFNFRDALWNKLKVTHPKVAAILAQGASSDPAASDAAAEARYTQLMEMQPALLGSFFNVSTAMSAIQLPSGTALDYIKGVIWDDRKNAFAQDRFFGWADPRLADQIIAARPGHFAPQLDPSVFHGGATRGWKQIQFGEANVQLTFHETEPTMRIGGINCVKVEIDIDYYKDLAAHYLLEVSVNGLSHSITDPKQVYVLRWMAGRHAGVPEFNPPYVIV